MQKMLDILLPLYYDVSIKRSKRYLIEKEATTMKSKKDRHWLVRCDCGNLGEAPESSLLSGEDTACPVCSGEIEQPI